MRTVDVLLVDDDDASREATALQLRSAGLEVETAPNGAAALARLPRCKPRLVIAGVKMPGMSGYELCRRIRDLSDDWVPFLLYSVRCSPSERAVGLFTGADGYLDKAGGAEALTSCVRQLLAAQPRRRGAPGSFDADTGWPTQPFEPKALN